MVGISLFFFAACVFFAFRELWSMEYMTDYKRSVLIMMAAFSALSLFSAVYFRYIYPLQGRIFILTDDLLQVFSKRDLQTPIHEVKYSDIFKISSTAPGSLLIYFQPNFRFKVPSAVSRNTSEPTNAHFQTLFGNIKVQRGQKMFRYEIESRAGLPITPID